jgi:hypothetical protein
MKPYQIFLVLAAFVLASLTLVYLNRRNDVSGVPEVATETIVDMTEPMASPEAEVIPVDLLNMDVPMTQDPFNAANISDESLVYQTQMSIENVMKFYRAAYTAKGYRERLELTMVSEDSFKMAFDGDPSGQAVVVRSEDLGDGSLLITVRLEDV